jgi:hypothetical protein
MGTNIGIIDMKKIQINQIINCEFEYQCDLDWDLLSETKDPKIRFCNQCKKDVKLCLSDDEIDRAWESFTCIAHPMYTEEMIAKIRAFEAGTGEWPFQGVSMPMGMPKRRS